MKRDMPPVHPGEILLEDFLKPVGITQYRLAKSIGVSQRRIGEIISGKRAITADTALRLARFFGTDAQSWMNLQTHYDLEVESERLADKLDQVVTYRQIANGYRIRLKKELMFSSTGRDRP
jgi:antitoxin HigA-1